MKIIDENGRIFGKVSIIDITVVLILAVLVIGIFVRTHSNEITSTSSTPNTEITYTICVQNTNSLFTDDFKVGDKVFMKNTGECYGEITDIRWEDAKVMSTTADGRTVYASYDDRVDIYLKVKATGIISGGRYLINRTSEIENNYQCEMNTRYVDMLAYIMELS